MVGAGDRHAGTDRLLKGVYEVSPHLGKRDLSLHDTDNGAIRVSPRESSVQKASGRHNVMNIPMTSSRWHMGTDTICTCGRQLDRHEQNKDNRPGTERRSPGRKACVCVCVIISFAV